MARFLGELRFFLGGRTSSSAPSSSSKAAAAAAAAAADLRADVVAALRGARARLGGGGVPSSLPAAEPASSSSSSEVCLPLPLRLLAPFLTFSCAAFLMAAEGGAEEGQLSEPTWGRERAWRTWILGHGGDEALLVGANRLPRLGGGRHFHVVVLEERIERVFAARVSGRVNGSEESGRDWSSHVQCALTIDTEQEVGERLEEGEGAVASLGTLVFLQRRDPLDNEGEAFRVQPRVVFGGQSLGDGELRATNDGRLDEHAAERNELLVRLLRVEVERESLRQRGSAIEVASGWLVVTHTLQG